MEYCTEDEYGWMSNQQKTVAFNRLSSSLLAGSVTPSWELISAMQRDTRMTLHQAPSVVTPFAKLPQEDINNVSKVLTKNAVLPILGAAPIVATRERATCASNQANHSSAVNNTNLSTQHTRSNGNPAKKSGEYSRNNGNRQGNNGNRQGNNGNRQGNNGNRQGNKNAPDKLCNCGSYYRDDSNKFTSCKSCSGIVVIKKSTAVKIIAITQHDPVSPDTHNLCQLHFCKLVNDKCAQCNVVL